MARAQIGKGALRRFFSAFIIGAGLCLGGQAAAREPTQSKHVRLIEVFTQSGAATYYFAADGVWGAANCQNLAWAYLPSNQIGARELLAVAMQAIQLGKPVVLYGECESEYFRIDTILVTVWP